MMNSRAERLLVTVMAVAVALVLVLVEARDGKRSRVPFILV
jgi:hypothetical protein